MNKKIFVFGDSIAWGAWDREGGWVARLKRDIDARVISSNFDYYIALYNLSVSGDTTREVLARFEREIAVRIEADEEVSVIFAVGINDSYVYLPDKTNQVALPVFEKNIEQLYTLAKNYSPEIVFIGLTPVDESLVNPIPWKENYSYFNEEIDRYNTYIEQFSQQHRALFIDVKSAFQEYTELLSDGLHPNTTGHEKMYRCIREKLVGNSIM